MPCTAHQSEPRACKVSHSPWVYSPNQWLGNAGSLRHTKQCENAPGWSWKMPRSSSSLVCSLRFPMNSVLQGGLSFVFVTGA